METITTNQLIYAIVQVNHTITRVQQVIKQQLFAARSTMIKDHLICSLYYHKLTNELVSVVKELNTCKSKLPRLSGRQYIV